MDGMNEKGLCVAVLMIEGRPGFDQNTEKPGLTITTTVRLLLDKAGEPDRAKWPLCFARSFVIAMTNPATVLSGHELFLLRLSTADLMAYTSTTPMISVRAT